MAVKMVLFWFSLIITIIGSNALGEFAILHSPDSLSFTENAKNYDDGSPFGADLLDTDLKDVFCASLGLSVEENTEWNSLHIIDPFSTPEAVVEVYIDGVKSLDNAANQNVKSFQIVDDGYEADTFNSVKHQIKQRFSNGASKLVNINLSKSHQLSSTHLFGDISVQKVPQIPLKHLQYSDKEDYQFLKELEVLKTIAQKVRSGVITPNNVVDFYFFKFRSVHDLSDFYGPNSLRVKEAKKLLGEVLKELSAAFVKAYDGSVLVTAVATDQSHNRRIVRQAQEGNTTGNATVIEYSSDYAAVFNIILWFNVVFVFSLVAIVYALADMDPGRDSIIYRMTSTRMKKDN